MGVIRLLRHGFARMTRVDLEHLDFEATVRGGNPEIQVHQQESAHNDNELQSSVHAEESENDGENNNR